MLPLTNICREEPVFAGKVTCGVRNETSGQSWPSNTVPTDPFTGQNRNSKCGSGIQHKRLGGWRQKTKTLYLPFQTLRYIGMAARGVLSSLPFSPINLEKGDVSFEGSAIIRAGGVDTPIAAGHTRYGTDEMDFDPVCVDDCRTVVCRTQDRAGQGTGYARQLGDRGCARTCLLVCMGGVHTACD